MVTFFLHPQEIMPLDGSVESASLSCYEVVQLLLHHLRSRLNNLPCSVEYRIPSLSVLAEKFQCSALELLRCFEHLRDAGFNYRMGTMDDPIAVWAENTNP